MTSAQRCHHCGADLRSDAPRGLCPACLLRLAAEGEAKDVLSFVPRLHYFGDYELLEEIARGGMGVVYKARQLSLGRIVAVKMMQPGIVATDEEVQRFRAEATAAASLQHPNIVAIHEIGEQDGLHYFSMDYIEGDSLAGMAARKPLEEKVAAAHVRTLAATIQYAHDKGIIHRDLKPANVLFDRAGQLHITDFGLARAIDRHSSLTATGTLLGTPSYMAPEQAEGGKNLGPTTDVYALGVILYELLVGRPPFQGPTPLETVQQVLHAEPVMPRQLRQGMSRDLETICLAALRKDPQRRYQTAQALADDLGRFLRGEPIVARRIGMAVRVWRWCRRHPWQTTAIAALVVVAMLTIASTVAFRSRLFQSLLQQARLQRAAGDKAGEVDALRRAARIRNDGELRQEMIQMAITPGARLVSRIPFGSVHGYQFSADSRLLVIKGRDYTRKPERTGTRVWDTDSRRWLGELTASDDLSSLGPEPTFVGTGSQVVSVQRREREGSTVVLWEARTGKELARVPVHNEVCVGYYDRRSAALMSPDRRYVATSGCSEIVDTASHDARLIDGELVAFLANGSYLTVDRGERLAQVDVVTQKVRTIGPASAEFRALSRNGDVALLQMESRPRTAAMALLWDIPNNRAIASTELEPDSWSFLCPDGRAFAILEKRTNSFRLYRLVSGEPFLREVRISLPPPAILLAHTLNATAASFSSDGSLFAALVKVGTKGEVRIWARNGDLVATLPGNSLPVWSPDGRLLATIGGGEVTDPDNVDGVWSNLTVSDDHAELSTGNSHVLVWRITPPAPAFFSAEPPTTLSFNPEGTKFISSQSYDSAAIWNVRPALATGRNPEFQKSLPGCRAWFDAQGTMWSAAISGPANAKDQWLQLWREERPIAVPTPDDSRLKGVSTTSIHDRAIAAARGAVVSPNGKRAAYVWSPVVETPGGGRLSGGGLLLDLVDLDAGKQLASLTEPEWPTTGRETALFSPDSKLLVIDGQSRTGCGFTAWDATTGALVPSIKTTTCVNSPWVFAADSRLLFSARLCSILATDMTTGETREWVKSPVCRITLLAASREGRWLVAGSESTIVVWNAATGVEWGRWVAHDSPLSALAVHGNLVASGAQDGSLRFWDLDWIEREIHEAH